MKTSYLTLVSIIVLVALSAGPVFAQLYSPQPIVSSNGAPAFSPALGANKMGGVLVVKYISIENQVPLVLQNTQVTLQLCGTGGCTNVLADLTNTGPGTYTYSFSVPSSPTGSVTITLPALSLTDDYGQPFPSAPIQIGSYSSPSKGTAGASNPPSSSLPASSPERVQQPGVYREAVPLATNNQESTTVQISVASIILTLAAFGLLLLRRRQ